MGTSVERRRRKKHKSGKLEMINKSLLYSLLGSEVSRKSRKRSRSSSSPELRKSSRQNRREKKKSRKNHCDIKQEKLDSSNEALEISNIAREQTEIEVITIDEFSEESPKEIFLKPKEEFMEQSPNNSKTMDIFSDQTEGTLNTRQKMNALSITTQSENLDNSQQTSQMLENNPENECIALTCCSTLVEFWKCILHQGLSSNANEELRKVFRLTDDCQAFKAPPLNGVIKSLLSGAEIVRDDIEIEKQNQLGSLLGSMQKGIDLILHCGKRSSNLGNVLVIMNDAASFIAQLHYSISLQRRMRIAEEIGIVQMEIATRVGERLFSEEEEKEMQQRLAEFIELAVIDDEVEKRLAAAKEAELEKYEEAKKIAEEEAKKIAEEEAKKIAEEKAKKIAEEKAKKIAEEEAKKIAEEKAKKIAEEEAKKVAEEEAKKIAEEKAKKIAEEEAKKIAEEEAKKLAEKNANEMAEEEVELEETPLSQRFGTSRHFGRTLFKAKLEGLKGVKTEGRVKFEKGTTLQFVPDNDFPGIEKVMTMAREKQGFPKNAIPIALKALAKSTLASYKPHIQKWWDFSRRESCDTFDPKLSDIMEFFVECYDNGMSINTLKSARSALSYLVSKDLGKNEFLSVVFQGFSKKA